MRLLPNRSLAMFLGAGIATGALALTSMWRPAPAAQISPSLVTCYGFTTIEQGHYSGFGDYCQFASADSSESLSAAAPTVCYASVAQPEVEAIIRNECAWADFWEEHTDNQFPPPPLPSIDFSRYVVVAVISGTRPNGCYGMEITHISKGSCGGRTIHVREQVPCAGQGCTLALTNNYHFIRVCKEFLPFDVPTCFEHRNLNEVCNLTVDCLETSDTDR